MLRAKKHEPPFCALRDINLEVSHGETLGIIGSNGSGKSTLLRLMAGITTPSSGTVVVAGKLGALIELGAGFHPELSGRDNIFLNGAILGLHRTEIQDRFSSIVDFAELHDFIDTPVKYYSSGMYLRLGFAIAVNVDAEILLVDEVLAVGDAPFQRKCAEWLTGYQKKGGGAVLVSHNMELVERSCSRVIWIDRGLIRAEGDPGVVVHQYYASSIEHNTMSSALPIFTGKASRADSATSGTTTEAALFRHHSPIIITGVCLANANNRAAGTFRTGEPLVVNIAYEAREVVQCPILHVAIGTQDGTAISSTDSSGAGLRDWLVQGSGEIALTIDALPLLQGHYFVYTSITSANHPYRLSTRMVPLSVISPTGNTQSGLVAVPSRWTVSNRKDF